MNILKASTEEIQRQLKDHNIGLTPDEARKVARMLKRNPTLTEAVIWGIQGSEHSSYKSTRKYLKKLPTDAPNVILGPSEDSGIVEIARYKGIRYGIVMSHESHNHPSQLVPYEGAATGVGGIMRDIVCMGARAIACMDSLRFGDLNDYKTKYIASEVVNGVAGYGNPLGVPNLGGDVYFHPDYNDNCLVNVVGFGVLAEDEIIHSYAPEDAVDYDIIFVGKPTDRSGMGGASFASGTLTEEDSETNKGAVQEPNPFLERHVLAATYELFDILKEKKLIDRVGFKDMGAGGNMCASVELADGGGYGAKIDLEQIHVAEADLPPSVIACSETQERFCWVVPPDLSPLVLKHYNTTWALPDIAYNARASKAGVITKKQQYILTYNDQEECNAPIRKITKGLQYNRKKKKPKKSFKEPSLKRNRKGITIKAGKEKLALGSIEDITYALLSSPNIASRRHIYEQYDTNVQGMIHHESGMSNGGVMAPLIDREELPNRIRQTGVSVSVDGNPRYGEISPYYQAINALYESCRNVVATGATPQALTDCLNFGNPEIPEQMWEFGEAIRGLRYAATQLKLKDHPSSPIPFISGNVSLYNESGDGNSIPPSALVACVGTLPSYKHALTPEFKEPDNILVLIGKRADECGGSAYYELAKQLGKNVPKPNLTQARKQLWTLIDLAEQRLLKSLHDISEGGLMTALCEMACMSGNNVGFDINHKQIKQTSLPLDIKLFSETPGFVCEVSPDEVLETTSQLKRQGVEYMIIGSTSSDFSGIIRKGKRKIVHEIDLDHARERWDNSLNEFMK